MKSIIASVFVFIISVIIAILASVVVALVMVTAITTYDYQSAEYKQNMEYFFVTNFAMFINALPLGVLSYRLFSAAHKRSEIAQKLVNLSALLSLGWIISYALIFIGLFARGFVLFK